MFPRNIQNRCTRPCLRTDKIRAAIAPTSRTQPVTDRLLQGLSVWLSLWLSGPISFPVVTCIHVSKSPAHSTLSHAHYTLMKTWGYRGGGGTGHRKPLAAGLPPWDMTPPTRRILRHPGFGCRLTRGVTSHGAQARGKLRRSMHGVMPELPHLPRHRMPRHGGGGGQLDGARGGGSCGLLRSTRHRPAEGHVSSLVRRCWSLCECAGARRAEMMRQCLWTRARWPDCCVVAWRVSRARLITARAAACLVAHCGRARTCFARV